MYKLINKIKSLLTLYDTDRDYNTVFTKDNATSSIYVRNKGNTTNKQIKQAK